MGTCPEKWPIAEDKEGKRGQESKTTEAGSGRPGLKQARPSRSLPQSPVECPGRLQRVPFQSEVLANAQGTLQAMGKTGKRFHVFWLFEDLAMHSTKLSFLDYIVSTTEREFNFWVQEHRGDYHGGDLKMWSLNCNLKLCKPRRTMPSDYVVCATWPDVILLR